jgi:hypothetical protein
VATGKRETDFSPGEEEMRIGAGRVAVKMKNVAHIGIAIEGRG